ncbi:uncharacterized protein PHACADRAFT_31439 [Phanerochaete carnosa HHB-10118-sp]|uniref:GCF C-terminal domain-containing protein n=1 Tax=Phanerochaete carnosa (strain HHB-10118-sp) TaxID=650164 RepID=K5WMR0_PHACS|nr:uncharacterized protein PHACADRAFT_31439 [Phanerochaete carnosa HHB-10118-sp]EKM51607.1 hypothetical protein PHACADRAFT_31439 [Phanerochaete carnosa HHB-10118-sp]
MSILLTPTARNATAAAFDPTSTPARTNGAPTYSAEYLSELKASTPSTRPRLQDDDSISYDADVSLAADTLAQSSLASIVDLTGDADTEASILSSSAVQAAKEKRDRLRKMRTTADEDFISLSVTKHSDIPQGPHPESRLMREEDELGEGDDEYAEYTSAQERIALGKKSKKVEARKRREEMSELILEAEEQDEETMEWEAEQLRRGGTYVDEVKGEAAKPVYKPAPSTTSSNVSLLVPTNAPIPDLDLAVARLKGSLTSLTTSHQQNTASMASLAQERVQLEQKETEMREMIVKTEDKRSWFAAFREWVENIATFLDEKYPQLEKLEEEHVSLLQERYDLISQRRRVDDDDDLSLFLGSLPAPPQSQEIDELGRVVPVANSTALMRDRTVARSGRRLRRRAQNQTQEEEGYSTDATLPPSDAADFQTAISKLLNKGQDVLSDVRAKDFREPSQGLGKWFGEWREKFGDSYTGAWGGLGMISGWEFWTRLEILGWDPLEDKRSLDTFSWYKSLYGYSRPRHAEDDEDDEEPELGPDGDLVSAMISTAIIPRVCKLVDGGALDPYSAKDIRNLIDLAEQIEASTERDSLKFQTLLKSVLTVFQRAVESAETAVAPYLTLNRPRFDPESVPARQRFLARRQKLLNNMVRWRKYSGERFGIGMLITNLVSSCMLPVAESGWEVGGEERMKKTAAMLPNELVPVVLVDRLEGGK